MGADGHGSVNSVHPNPAEREGRGNCQELFLDDQTEFCDL